MAWYALYTRPRHEKRVAEQLSEKGIESYVPSTRQLRQWKDRKKWVEMPLFNGYVFVNLQLKYKLMALETPGVINMVSFGGVPAEIPDWQISQLQRVLAETADIEPVEYLRVGDPVEITEGTLNGVRGYLREIRGESRVAIMLDGIYQSASFVVERHAIRKLDGETATEKSAVS